MMAQFPFAHTISMTYRLRDGYLIDPSLPVASADNDYLIDRDMQ